jgi:pimeloyl-ACP methyl ester carboxylesterase
VTIVVAIVAALAAIWALSLAGTLVINRSWPARGRVVRVDGLDVHVVEVPASQRDATLVLIHGASGNVRELLAALQEPLAGRFNLIAIDRPGHGHTSCGDRTASDPERQAEIVGAALDALGVGPAIVLGHSWGGAVALALALRRPELVSGLVLVAPASHPWPGGVARRTRLFARPYVGRALAELVLLPLGLVLVGPVVRRIFAPDPVPPGFSRRIGALLAIRPGTFAAGCRDIADLSDHLARLSRRYGEIRVPTEIVAGDNDRVVSTRHHAGGLARDIPGARLTVLAGAGHMPHWSRTEEVVAAIDRVAEPARQRSRAVSDGRRAAAGAQLSGPPASSSRRDSAARLPSRPARRRPAPPSPSR